MHVFSQRVHLAWALTGIGISVGTLLFRGNVPSDEEIRYVMRGLAFAAACVTVPTALELCYRLILNWARNLDGFVHFPDRSAAAGFLADLAPYFSNRVRYSFGAVWASAIVALTYRFSVHIHALDAPAKLVGITALFLANLLSGAGLVAVFGFSRALWRTTNSRQSTIRLSRDTFGVLSTGRLMLRVWGIALLLWMLYMIPLVEPLVHARPKVFTLEQSPVTLVFAVPALLFLVGSFVASQIPLHLKMIEEKRTTIERLRMLVDEVTPWTTNHASDELMRRFQFFEARLLSAQQLPEWPSTLVVAIGAVSVSAISTVLPSLLSPFFKAAIAHLLNIPGTAS